MLSVKSRALRALLLVCSAVPMGTGCPKPAAPCAPPPDYGALSGLPAEDYRVAVSRVVEVCASELSAPLRDWLEAEGRGERRRVLPAELVAAWSSTCAAVPAAEIGSAPVIAERMRLFEACGPEVFGLGSTETPEVEARLVQAVGNPVLAALVRQWLAGRPSGAAVADGVARSLVGPLPYPSDHPIDLPFIEGEVVSTPVGLVLDSKALQAGGKTVSAVQEGVGRFVLPPGNDAWKGWSVPEWRALAEQAGTSPILAVDSATRTEDLLRLAASVSAPGGSVRLLGIRVEGGQAADVGQIVIGMPAAEAYGEQGRLRLLLDGQGADLWDGAGRLAPIPGCEAHGPTICGTLERPTGALALAARLEPELRKARSSRADAQGSPVYLSAEPQLGVWALLEAATAVVRTGGKPVLALDEQPCLHGWKGMICVGGGQAHLGAPGDAKNPPRPLDVPTFYLDRHEVTVGEYRACIDDRAFCPKPSGFPARPSGALPGGGALAENLPVSGLSWEAADRFCTWSGKRLPTEWEWEKAARQPDGLPPSIDCAQAWHLGCGAADAKSPDAKPAPVKGPRPVSEGAPNAWGLVDMAGNVAEWTRSWMGSAAGKTPVWNLLGPCGGSEPCTLASQRVVRGGSWSSKTEELSMSRRVAASPAALKNTGVRCAVSGGEGDDPPPLLGRGSALHSPVLTKWPPLQLSRPYDDPGMPAPPSPDEIAVAHDVAEDDLEEKPVCAEEVVSAWNFPNKKGGRSETDCRDPVSYPYSNEHKLVVFRRFAQNQGGGYVGVGADQNYDFISLAKPRWAWLFDYDPNIVRLHRALKALILAAETPQDFLTFFEPKNAQKGAQVIRDFYKGDPAGEGYRYLFLRYQNLVGERYRRKAVPRSDDPGFGWLSDPARYAVVRTLYQQDRVVILGGDMLADKAMRGIGAAARKLGVPIRIFYTSNAPTSWGGQITPAWRANVAALPFDDVSVVLVTWNHGSFGGKDYWHYQVQRALTYQSRLQNSGYYHMFQMIWDRIPGDDADVTVIDLPSAPDD
jgi:formylglycine-generating enzyme required for sulfatase activity